MNAGTVVTIQPETSSTPVLAGSYSDVVTITVGPPSALQVPAA